MSYFSFKILKRPPFWNGKWDYAHLQTHPRKWEKEPIYQVWIKTVNAFVSYCRNTQTDTHTDTHTRTFFFAIPSNRLRSLRSFIKLKRTHCNTIILVCTLKSNDTCTELCMNIDIKPNGLTSVCGLFLLVTLSYFCKPCKIHYWGCPSASA